VNPLLYVLAYGAHFVAQGTPADMSGLATLIEEAIRFPGFTFVNVQSPCVTFGEPEQQLKAHKQHMVPLAGLGHDATDRIRAMALAREYGRTLHTGVLYRDPEPPPTYESLVAERQRELRAAALPRARILDLFRPA
jgi:2-oxoglutarate ferredoxin oxidoreductase subunit beta